MSTDAQPNVNQSEVNSVASDISGAIEESFGENAEITSGNKELQEAINNAVQEIANQIDNANLDRLADETEDSDPSEINNIVSQMTNQEDNLEVLPKIEEPEKQHPQNLAQLKAGVSQPRFNTADEPPPDSPTDNQNASEQKKPPAINPEEKSGEQTPEPNTPEPQAKPEAGQGQNEDTATTPNYPLASPDDKEKNDDQNNPANPYAGMENNPYEAMAQANPNYNEEEMKKNREKETEQTKKKLDALQKEKKDLEKKLKKPKAELDKLQSKKSRLKKILFLIKFWKVICYILSLLGITIAIAAWLNTTQKTITVKIADLDNDINKIQDKVDALKAGVDKKQNEIYQTANQLRILQTT